LAYLVPVRSRYLGGYRVSIIMEGAGASAVTSEHLREDQPLAWLFHLWATLQRVSQIAASRLYSESLTVMD
jgi:hypothetical protein